MRPCPNCGANVADTDEFCANCGTYLAWVKPEAEPAPATPAEQPHAVEPARPVTPRRARTAPDVVEPVPDGSRCEVCGTVNLVDAKFCRKCGTSLVGTTARQAAVRSRRFTWPRWLRWRGGSAWLRRIVALALVAVLVVAGILLYPLAVDLVQDVRDKLGSAAPISPSQTTGNAAVPGHPVTAAVDGVANQYWGAPAVGDFAEFTFAQPFRLIGVVITPGAGTDPAVFGRQARPTELDLVITTSNRATRTLHVSVADKPGPQTTDTGISDVVGIRLVIRAATPQDQPVAVGEVEFFKRA